MADVDLRETSGSLRRRARAGSHHAAGRAGLRSSHGILSQRRHVLSPGWRTHATRTPLDGTGIERNATIFFSFRWTRDCCGRHVAFPPERRQSSSSGKAPEGVRAGFRPQGRQGLRRKQPAGGRRQYVSKAHPHQVRQCPRADAGRFRRLRPRLHLRMESREWPRSRVRLRSRSLVTLRATGAAAGTGRAASHSSRHRSAAIHGSFSSSARVHHAFRIARRRMPTRMTAY